MGKENTNRWVIGCFVVAISLLFLGMIRDFLMVIVLSGIFSALVYPFYQKVLVFCRGRAGAASFLSLILLVLLILLPLTVFASVVLNQALKVSDSISPWLESSKTREYSVWRLLQGLPFFERLIPFKALILEKAGQVISFVANFILSSATSATRGTLGFLFKIFIFLYTTYFLLIDGEKLLRKILYYLPLETKDEERMLQIFTSVTKATLKGSAIIGTLQGFLAGLAFFALGIDSPVFWGTVMAVFSLIPGVGSSIIWIPAAIFLALSGHAGKALILTAFCALVVGMVDNLLRPKLVGKDTKMHALMIFLGVLGGLFFFGIVGVVLGPIVASLFVTVWEIYGEVFRDFLPSVSLIGSPKNLEIKIEDGKTTVQNLNHSTKSS